jgi:hypothetical protein
MVVGNAAVFALESTITRAYAEPGLRALGLFVVYIGGHRFGVYSADASLLANSFDEVARRILDRGQHTAAFSTEPNAADIVDAICRALYIEELKDQKFVGLEEKQFTEILYSNHLMWIPDGDAAFDDGSHVVQFDVQDRVRLIGFKRTQDAVHDAESLVELWLSGDTFYKTLEDWQVTFGKEWGAMPKSGY